MTQRHVRRHIQESDILAREIYRQDTIEADDRAFFLKMRDTIRSACDETMFDRTVENMRISTRQRISANPMDAVRVLANRFQNNVSERARILTRFFEDGRTPAGDRSMRLPRPRKRPTATIVRPSLRL